MHFLYYRYSILLLCYHSSSLLSCFTLCASWYLAFVPISLLLCLVTLLFFPIYYCRQVGTTWWSSAHYTHRDTFSCISHPAVYISVNLAYMTDLYYAYDWFVLCLWMNILLLGSNANDKCYVLCLTPCMHREDSVHVDRGNLCMWQIYGRPGLFIIFVNSIDWLFA